MAVPSELYYWADVFTLAGFNINKSGKIPDNIFKGLKGLEELTKDGRLELMDEGGDVIVEPLAYAKTGSFSSYRGYDTFLTTQPQQITAARFQIKQHGGTIQFSGYELETQNGSNGMRSLFKARVELGIMSGRDDFSRMLWLDGTGTDGKDFTGLNALAPENGLGTYGALDSSTYTWWQSYTKSVGSWDTYGDKYSRQALRKISQGRDSGKTDLILMTEGAYGFFEDHLHKNERLQLGQGLKNIDPGSMALTIAGVPCYYDLNMPADSGGLDHAYFLNTRYFKLKLRRARNFKLTPFQAMPAQDAVIAKVLSMGEFVCSNRRHQGRLYGITA